MSVQIETSAGVVTQSIRGMNGSRMAPGILQRAQITGDMHQIQNTLNIRVHMASQPGAAQPVAGMREALSSVQLLRPAGLF